MFIAILTYKKPLGEVDRFLAAHRDYLAEYYAACDFIASGPQTPRVGLLSALLVRLRRATRTHAA